MVLSSHANVGTQCLSRYSYFLLFGLIVRSLGGATASVCNREPRSGSSLDRCVTTRDGKQMAFLFVGNEKPLSMRLTSTDLILGSYKRFRKYRNCNNGGHCAVLSS